MGERLSGYVPEGEGGELVRAEKTNPSEMPPTAEELSETPEQRAARMARQEAKMFNRVEPKLENEEQPSKYEEPNSLK